MYLWSQVWFSYSAVSELLLDAHTSSGVSHPWESFPSSEGMIERSFAQQTRHFFHVVFRVREKGRLTRNTLLSLQNFGNNPRGLDESGALGTAHFRLVPGSARQGDGADVTPWESPRGLSCASAVPACGCWRAGWHRLKEPQPQNRGAGRGSGSFGQLAG